jgi:hypothetical protein
MIGSSIFAGLILFWPAILTLFFLGFCCIVFAVFLIGSTVLIVAIFIYGLYCILRDLGFLDKVFQKMGTITEMVSEHVKKNVEDSFVFEVCTKPVESPALYLCHPHGLYGLTWFIHFASGLSKWPFKNRPVLAVHSIFFQLPIFRELFQLNHCIEAKESEIQRSLQEGKSVALLVGGIEELHLTSPESIQLILKKREGYARLSKHCQVPLVPLISPSENILFPPTDLWLWKWIEQQLYRRFRIALPLPSWKNIMSWTGMAYKPFAEKLVTYIVEPVYPDTKSIEDIQSEYLKRIEDFSKEKKVPIQVVG